MTPRRIDWTLARTFYLEDERRSLADVARAFGVSAMTVGRHARRGRWQQEREQLHEQAAANVRGAVLQTLEERNRDTLLVAQLATTKMREQLTDPAFRLSGDGYAAIKKLEQLIEGEATERVELREVQHVIFEVGVRLDEALQQALAETLANGKRAAVLRAFRSRVPAALEEAQAQLGAAA